jgi:two-component system sensor histidine kinase DesK
MPVHDRALREPTPRPGAIMIGFAERRPRLRWVFLGITLFFTIWPFVSVVQARPEPVPLALLLLAWAIFGIILAQLARIPPFGRVEDRIVVLPAIVALTAIGAVTTTVFGVDAAPALFYYAGVSSARLVPQSWALRAISAISVVAGVSVSLAAGDPAAGVPVGITVGTISLTLSSLSALSRANRELQATRRELADLAVAEERNRIARDLHDTLGHSLSVIALKSELARRVLPVDPARADAELADVERVSREALASVRETVSGYRQPSLAIELAGARAALAAAGITGEVEPAPDGLPLEIDAMLGWAVREGVTNVLRHSDATRARIRVIADGASRSVEVTDDGRGLSEAADDNVAATAPGYRPGVGLAGLRERAASLGGSVEAGPLPDHGFRLLVRVPAGGTPAPSAVAGAPG